MEEPMTTMRDALHYGITCYVIGLLTGTMIGYLLTAYTLREK